MPTNKKKAAHKGRSVQSAPRQASKSSSGRGGNRSSKANNSSPVLVLFYEFFTGTYFGRVTVAVMLLCLVIILNLLISGDRFNWFFVLTGVELIAAAAGGWLYFLLREDGE